MSRLVHPSVSIDSPNLTSTAGCSTRRNPLLKPLRLVDALNQGELGVKRSISFNQVSVSRIGSCYKHDRRRGWIYGLSPQERPMPQSSPTSSLRYIGRTFSPSTTTPSPIQVSPSRKHLSPGWSTPGLLPITPQSEGNVSLPTPGLLASGNIPSFTISPSTPALDWSKSPPLDHSELSSGSDTTSSSLSESEESLTTNIEVTQTTTDIVVSDQSNPLGLLLHIPSADSSFTAAKDLPGSDCSLLTPPLDSPNDQVLFCINMDQVSGDEEESDTSEQEEESNQTDPEEIEVTIHLAKPIVISTCKAALIPSTVFKSQDSPKSLAPPIRAIVDLLDSEPLAPIIPSPASPILNAFSPPSPLHHTGQQQQQHVQGDSPITVYHSASDSIGSSSPKGVFTTSPKTVGRVNKSSPKVHFGSSVLVSSCGGGGGKTQTCGIRKLVKKKKGRGEVMDCDEEEEEDHWFDLPFFQQRGRIGNQEVVLSGKKKF